MMMVLVSIGYRPDKAVSPAIAWNDSRSPLPTFSKFRDSGYGAVYRPTPDLALAGYMGANPAVRGDTSWMPHVPPVWLTWPTWMPSKRASQPPPKRPASPHPGQIPLSARAQRLAMYLSPHEAELVAGLGGVRLVQRDERRQPLSDYGPAWIGAPGIWMARPRRAGRHARRRRHHRHYRHRHQRQRVTRPLPAPAAMATHTLIRGNRQLWGVCNSSEPDLRPTFPCNDKLIGAWDMLDDDARDLAALATAPVTAATRPARSPATSTRPR